MPYLVSSELYSGANCMMTFLLFFCMLVIRGLTPRLIIYMSQGSLFFASYEFFKRLFSLEAKHPTALQVQDGDDRKI